MMLGYRSTCTYKTEKYIYFRVLQEINFIRADYFPLSASVFFLFLFPIFLILILIGRFTIQNNGSLLTGKMSFFLRKENVVENT